MPLSDWITFKNRVGANRQAAKKHKNEAKKIGFELSFFLRKPKAKRRKLLASGMKRVARLTNSLKDDEETIKTQEDRVDSIDQEIFRHEAAAAEARAEKEAALALIAETKSRMQTDENELKHLEPKVQLMKDVVNKQNDMYSLADLTTYDEVQNHVGLKSLSDVQKRASKPEQVDVLLQDLIAQGLEAFVLHKLGDIKTGHDDQTVEQRQMYICTLLGIEIFTKEQEEERELKDDAEYLFKSPEPKDEIEEGPPAKKPKLN